MKTFAITARAAIAAMLLGGVVAAGDAAAQSGGHGGGYASNSRVAHNQPQDPRATRQPNLGGGFLELLITGRDPTPRRQAAPSQAQPRTHAAPPPVAQRQAAPVRRAQPSRQAQPAPRQAQPQAPRQAARTAPGYRAHQDIAPARVIPARPVSRQAALQSPRQSAPANGSFRRQVVSYSGPYSPGTIVVDTKSRHLFFVESNGKAIRYGVGVGREGFSWRGTERVTRKAEWPDWRPPESMRRRQPELPRFMAGGPENPLGARALYLGNTLYRIHGTNEPHTIGQAMSSGCIRMMNEDVKDLYERVRVGAKVVVL